MSKEMPTLSEMQNYLAHLASDTPPSTGVAIVAVPRDMDPIRLVGDEDKHATILYFGDYTGLPSEAKTTITETLQNVSQLFTPFAESIIDVGRLGNDDPPALVAKLTGNILPKIRQALLINPKLGEYLANATQYPSYTPHVTLGYPDYQGEADLRKVMKDLYRIRFDRLSLWWGDEHTDFSLGMPDMMSEMAQTSLSEAKNQLAHLGFNVT